MAKRPLYARVADVLLEAIAEGRLRPGDRLPTEHELVRRHRVSRITVRQSLEILRQRGLIERYPGRGSFVRAPAAAPVWTVSAIEAHGSAGGDTHLGVIDWKEVRTPASVKARLGPVGPTVHRLRATYNRKGTPVCYAETFVPAAIGRRIEVHEIRTTVLDVIEKRLGITVPNGVEEITAGMAEGPVARRLRVRARTPVLVIDFTFFAADGRPIEHVTAWYRPDQFLRRNQLTRLRDPLGRDGRRPDGRLAGRRALGATPLEATP